MIQNIASNLAILNEKIAVQFEDIRENLKSLNTTLQEHRGQTASELAYLRSSQDIHTRHILMVNRQTAAELANLITSLNHSLEGSFDSQTSEQLAELANLQISLNSAHSKLDSLKNATAQLFADHQEIQANTSVCRERTETEVEPTIIPPPNDTCEVEVGDVSSTWT